MKVYHIIFIFLANYGKLDEFLSPQQLTPIIFLLIKHSFQQLVANVIEKFWAFFDVIKVKHHFMIRK